MGGIVTITVTIPRGVEQRLGSLKVHGSAWFGSEVPNLGTLCSHVRLGSCIAPGISQTDLSEKNAPVD